MSDKNDNDFTGIKNGVVYQNGKPICEIFRMVFAQYHYVFSIVDGCE